MEDGARDASELLPSARYGDEEEEGESALGAAVGAARESLSNPAVRNLGILGLSVLAGSFLLSAYNVYMKYNSNRSKRKRQVNKNVVVVERLRDFFPDNRDSLTRGHIRGLQGKTGFKPPEIFRKYARYKLNEEPFTNAFVADVLALRRACELDGETVAAVLEETGERIVKKYGTLMRDVADMGPAGAQRKADGCAMFAKVMYLADLEEFVPAELWAGDAAQAQGNFRRHGRGLREAQNRRPRERRRRHLRPRGDDHGKDRRAERRGEGGGRRRTTTVGAGRKNKKTESKTRGVTAHPGSAEAVRAASSPRVDRGDRRRNGGDQYGVRVLVLELPFTRDSILHSTMRLTRTRR